MNDDRENSPSASAFRRYELCPGSFQLQLKACALGQEAHKGGQAAARGERIHAYLAGIPDEDGNEIKLSESEQETADKLQERAQEQVRRIFGDQPLSVLKEKRLWLKV